MPNQFSQTINDIETQGISSNDVTRQLQEQGISTNDTIRQLKEQGIMSTSAKIYLNLGTTLEEKQRIIQEKGFQKELNLEGVSQGYVVGSPDADGVLIEDIHGNVTEGRTYSSLNPYMDAIETELFKVQKNKNKRKYQPKFVAEISKKKVEELTEQDYVNVARWQQEEGLLNPLRGVESGTSYDSNKQYTGALQEGERIPVFYKIKGYDTYNRPLVELINPNTKKQVTYDFGKNPYFNANIRVEDTFDNIPNRARTVEGMSKNNEKLARGLELQEQVYDSDNRILENIDIIQSAFLQSGANILSLFNREFLGKPIDTLDSVLSKNGIPTVAELTNPELGSEIADIITGVKSSTREAYNKGMQEAYKEFTDGNYLNALYKVVGQVDRILAESAPQMTAMAVSAGSGGGLAIGTLLLAATDQTARNANEYKYNNNGKEWSIEQYALDFALNTALLIPERILIASGMDKLVKKPLTKLFNKIPDNSNIFEVVKTIATSSAGEGIQEYLQGVEQAYMTRNRSESITLYDVASDPEQLFSGFVGGIVGGTVSGIPATVVGGVNTAVNFKEKQINTKVKEVEKKVTTFNENADIELSAEVINKVNGININNYTPENLEKVNNTLEQLSLDPLISIEARKAIEKKKAEIEASAILSNKDVVNTIENKQEALERIIYYSDPKSEADREKLDTIGEALGIPKEEVRKSLTQVDFEAKFGVKGYITYRQTLESINKALQNTELNKAEKNKLNDLKNRTIAALESFKTSQVDKLNTINNALEKLFSGDKKVTYTSKGSAPFSITLEDVLDYDFNSYRKIYSVINKSLDNIEGIENALKFGNVNTTNTVNTLKNNITTTVNKIKNKAITPDKEVKTNTFTKASKEILTAIKNSKDLTEPRGVRQAIRKYGIESFKVAKQELEQKDNKKYSDMISKLNKVITSVENRIKTTDTISEAIESSENVDTIVNEQTPSTDADVLLESNLETEKSDETNKNKTKLEKAKETIKNLTSRISEVFDTSTVDNSNNIEQLDKLDKALIELDTVKATLQEQIDAVENQIDLNNRSILTTKSTKYKNRLIRENKEYKNILKDLKKEYKRSYSNKVFKLEERIKRLASQMPNEAVRTILNKSYLKDLVVADTNATTLFGISNIDPNSTIGGIKVRSVIADISNAIKTSTFKTFDSMVSVKEQTALPFIFSDTQKRNKEGDLVGYYANANVAAAIDYSVKEFFLHSSKMLNPYTIEDIARAYGYTDKTDVTYEVQEAARLYGVYRVTIADMLGTSIAKNLGIKANKKVPQEEYKRFISSLGNIALGYAEYKGWVQDTILDNAFVPVKENTPLTFHVVKGTYDEVQIKKFKEYYDKTEFIRLEKYVENTPKPYPATNKANYTIKNTMTLGNTPKTVTEVLNKINKQAYVVNRNIVTYIKDNYDLVKEYLGYTENYEVFSQYSAESQKAKNKQIVQQMDALIELADKNNDEWFLNHFFSINGRYNVDSTTVNPMQDSALARWIFTPKYRTVTVNIDNIEHMETFKYALAQSFGFKVDKRSTDKRKAYEDKILNLNVDVIKEAIQNKTLKELDINPEHFGHFLVGLEALESYQNALTNGDNTFVTSLSAESDSTTSGYFLKMLLFPLNSVLKKYGQKVGILKNKVDIHNLKDTKGFLDIYETSAVALKLPSVKDISVLLKENSKKKFIKSTKYIKSVDVDFTIKLYEKLINVLPKIADNNNIVKEELASLRDLFKSPNMTFGYGARINSIRNNISHALTLEMLDRFASNTLSKDEAIIFNNLARKVGISLKELQSMIRTTSTEDIFFKDKKVSLGDYLQEVIARTYGDAVYNTLFKEFKEFAEIGFYMNSAFTLMYKEWQKEFNTIYDTFVKKENRNPSLEEEIELIKSTFDKFPVIPSAHSTELNEGIMIFDTDKVIGELKNKVVYRVGKETKYVTLRARINKISEAVTSGAVNPIHWFDGTIMTQMLKDYDVTGIHDAVVPTLLNHRKVIKDYNKQSYVFAKNYNLFETIFNRLDYVMANFVETNTIDIKDYDNFLNLEKGEDITYKIFKDSMQKKLADINKARNIFYNGKNKDKVIISNMNGLENTFFSVTELEQENDSNIKEIVTIDNPTYSSDPNLYTTDKEYTQLLEGSLTNTEVRLEIIDRINALENNRENQEHIDFLKSIIGNINGKNLETVIMGINTQANNISNRGFFNTKNNMIGIDLNTNGKDLVSYADKSGAEIYAHEIIHAILTPVLLNHQAYGKSKVIRKLLQLQKQAMDIITIEDLMPNTSLDVKKDTARAEELWNYMFNNPDIKNLRGLQEFISHGLTNEKIVNKLKDIKVKGEKVETKFIDKLVNLAKDLLDFIMSKKSFAEIFPNIASMLIGETTFKNDNIFNTLHEMVNNLADADKQAIDKIKYPNKSLEKIFGLVHNTIQKGNILVSPYLKDFITIADKLGIKMVDKKFDSTRFEDIVFIAKAIPLMLFSEQAREAIPLILKILGFNYDSFAQVIIKDMSEPDTDSENLEALGLLSRRVEQISKGLESTVYSNLVTEYGKRLSSVETEAITKVGFQTDLSVLLDHMDYNTIKDILNDSNRLTKEIKAYEDALDNDLWILNQSKMLGYYMTTGKGNEALNLNAHNIARGVGYKRLSYDSRKETNIDILSTLYAISFMPKETKEVFVSLGDKGNINLLKAHRNFVKESQAELFNNKFHMVKGYFKQIYDTTVDFMVAPLSESNVLEQAGYKLVKTIADNKITSKVDMGLYKNSLNTNRNRNGATFLLQGQHSMGTSLREISKQDSMNKEDLASFMFERYRKEADIVNKKINKYLSNSTVDFTELDKMTGRFAPIVNSYGKIVDYRISMDYETKKDVLQQDLDGLVILSRMYAQKVIKVASVEQNKKIFQFLLKDMKTNFTEKNLLGLNKKAYVAITKDSSDTFIQEAYKLLPSEAKKYITQDNPLYVREDWLLNLFGVSDTSITDTTLLKKTPLVVQRATQVAEAIMKALASITKVNIVLRTPQVLLGNIISNFNYSVMNGTNPLTTFKLQLENAQNIRDYINNKKALNSILFKQSIGTATKKELSTINWYKSRLETNPVHPLMQKGMYQAIIEDVTVDNELSETNVIVKFMNKKFNWIPKPIKETFRHAYIAKGTPIYQFMLIATQYSDFVARATEYQIAMNKAPKDVDMDKYEKMVSAKVLNAFINYDKPSSAVEQYLNDMGLMMFTKFGKRIQSVIKRSVIDNPVSVALFLATQFAFVDSDDILEQNLINKNIGALFYNPWDIMTSVLVPSSVRVLNE